MRLLHADSPMLAGVRFCMGRLQDLEVMPRWVFYEPENRHSSLVSYGDFMFKLNSNYKKCCSQFKENIDN